MGKTLRVIEASNLFTSFNESDFLGSGAYASVRRCYQNVYKNVDRTVVIKCFSLTGSGTAISVVSKELKQEAEVLSRLKHKNIVKLFGVTEWGSCYGLVMEEATGYNLEDLFLHEPDKVIPWQLRGRILYDIANGLDYLHNNFQDRSYIHGDLKLQNILLNESLVAKIVDFGAVDIAMISGVETLSIEFESSKQYTILYSPPELLNDPSSKKACAMDMYSYGLIGYEIITRQRVFYGLERSPIGKMIQLIRDRDQKPKEKPLQDIKQSLRLLKEIEIFSDLENIVKSCWKTKPDQRLKASIVKSDLEKFKTMKLKASLKKDLTKQIAYQRDKKVCLNEFVRPFRSVDQPNKEVSILSSTSHLGAENIRNESRGSKRKLESIPSSFAKRHTSISSSSIGEEDAQDWNKVTSGKEEKLINRSSNRASQGAVANHGKAYYTGRDVSVKTVGRDHIENYFGNEKPDQNTKPSPLLPLSNLKPPVINMKKTAAYYKVFKKVRNMKKAIVFLHGLPGSGKSQLVSKLGIEYPFVEEESLGSTALVRHIRCKDCANDVKEELQKLTDQLCEKEQKSEINDHLEQNISASLVDYLLCQKYPVLIIIENPEVNKNKELLEDLLRNLSFKSKKNDGQPQLHIYITSRIETSTLCGDEIRKSSIFTRICIKGFNKTESLQYLKQGLKTDRIAIFKRYGGLPQGLKIAKTFCNKHYGYSFSEYIDLLHEFEYHIIEREKKEIEEEYGSTSEHLFQAIVFLIDKSKGINSKILSCVSYLCYDRIQLEALEFLYDCLYEPKPIANHEVELNVRHLVQSLVDHDMCRSSGHEELAFNDVVMTAFRCYDHGASETDFNPFDKAVELLLELKKKERFLDNCFLIFHVRALLNHGNKQREIIKDVDKFEQLQILENYLNDLRSKNHTSSSLKNV